jgi:hypothetical protein
MKKYFHATILTLLTSTCFAVEKSESKYTFNADEKVFMNANSRKQSLDQGCYIGKKLYTVGESELMNREALALYKEKTGYNPSDAFAVLMQCLYIVDPQSSDHPEVNKRKYIWVAG